MSKLKVLSLFAGIGGFDLGLERTGGFETVAFCEIDEHCQKVLYKHWPYVHCFEDIKKLSYLNDTYGPLKGEATEIYEKIDVICGGFPCQDISVGGKGEGLDGEKSRLWYEYLRIIREVKPKYVIIENVERLRKKGLGIILKNLSEIGYDVEWHCIPSSSIGKMHTRDRLFAIAYASSQRLDEYLREERHLPTYKIWENQKAYSKGEGRKFKLSPFRQILSRRSINLTRDSYTDERAIVSRLRRVTNGIPEGMDERRRKQRIKQLGNSVDPQIVQLIGEGILEFEMESKSL